MGSFLEDIFGGPEIDQPFKKSSKLLDRFLRGGLTEGFDEFGGDRVAELTPDQQAIIGQFFQSLFPDAMKGLMDIAGQDSLGRAEGLLAPATERATQRGQRAARERSSLGNNLFSTGGAAAEGEAVGSIQSNMLATLAQLLPQLDSIRLQSIAAVPGLTTAGLGIGDIQRQIQQQKLDSAYQEFLRTTPSGGPLQALLGLHGGGGQTQFQQQPTWSQNLLSAAASFFGGPAGAAMVNNWTGRPPEQAKTG